MITSLLQVVNRLAASCELRAGLMRVVLSTLLIYQVETSLMFTDLMQLDEVNRLDATANCIRPVKSTTCIKSVAFLAVYCELPNFNLK